MDANTKAIFDKMIIDGGRLTWLHNGNDILFQRKERIYAALADAGMSAEAIAKGCKIDVVVSGKTDRKHLDCAWLNGAQMMIVLIAFPHWWRNVTELHSKVFLLEREPTSNNDFVDACWSSRFSATVAAFRGVPSAKSRKSSGQKGVRFGNPKSDLHVVAYKAKNEKTGIEVHQKGRALQRAKNATERLIVERQYAPMDANDERATFTYEVHAAAARKITKSLRDAGINIADFFDGTSSVSWYTALHDNDVRFFDHTLEMMLVKVASIARSKAQLPLPFTPESDDAAS